MVTASAYWRPSTLTQVFELLERPGAVVLAGGTRLNGDASTGQVEVVDLQALHLEGIRPSGGDLVRIGAMVRLQEVADSEAVPAVVREAARRERPSTLRAQGTLGGCVVSAEAESELLAALLVHEAVVHFDAGSGDEETPLEDFLADPANGAAGAVRVVTAVTIRTDGVAAAAHTARTPADRAIVAAFARATGEGQRIALTGVASTPVLVRPGDELRPPGDFRGSSEYRRALADVLTVRVMEAIS